MADDIPVSFILQIYSYVDKLTAMVPYMFEKGIRTVERRDDEFNVINHGDCWVNNMLFRYDENSKPIQQIFVSINVRSPEVLVDHRQTEKREFVFTVLKLPFHQ